LQSQEVYDDSFLNKLLKLTKDKVPNVRLIVSKTLFMMLATETYKKTVEIKIALELLKNDNDKDVARNAGQSFEIEFD